MPDPSLTPRNPDGWLPLTKAVPGMALALAGAVVRLINSQNDAPTVRTYIGGLITAAFAGALVAYLLADLEWSPHLKTFAVGITGYTARDILAILSRWWSGFIRRNVHDSLEPTDDFRGRGRLLPGSEVERKPYPPRDDTGFPVPRDEPAAPASKQEGPREP